MIVLGVDPGKTTGVCMLQVGKTVEVIMAEQILWDHRKEDLWALFIATFREGLPVPQYTVIENFRLRPGRAMEQVGSTFPSVEVIGLIEAFHFVSHNHFQIVYQEPSAISRVAVHPEHAHFFVGLPHAMDAYKHARYFCVMAKSKGIYVDLTEDDPNDGLDVDWAFPHGYGD